MDVMIVALIGAAFGAYRARKRGGNRKDMAQYGAVFGIIFALGGLILSIIYTRLFAG